MLAHFTLEHRRCVSHRSRRVQHCVSQSNKLKHLKHESVVDHKVLHCRVHPHLTSHPHLVSLITGVAPARDRARVRSGWFVVF